MQKLMLNIKNKSLATLKEYLKNIPEDEKGLYLRGLNALTTIECLEMAAEDGRYEFVEVYANFLNTLNKLAEKMENKNHNNTISFNSTDNQPSELN